MPYNLIIIGAGPAGYTAAEMAGKAGLSVALFEKRALGGICLNEGCIPTKTLLYSAKLYDHAKHSAKYGVTMESATADLPKIIARKNKVVRKLVLGIKAKLNAQNVTIIEGEAYIVDARTVRCGDTEYRCDHLLVCTGSEAVVPPIPGIDGVPYITHREALDEKELPASIAIIGGGVIGMEFASFYNSLGVKVTVIEMLHEIVGGMDVELAAMLRAEYAKRGVDFLLGSHVSRVEHGQGLVSVHYQQGEETGIVSAEKLLLSTGRRPVTTGYGLERLRLELTERGTIKVDAQMRTSCPDVYVCGDLTGYSLLAHTAAREAEVAVHTILGKEDAMNYRAIPGVVYTNPEFAGVGETEASLRHKGIAYRVHTLPMSYSGRFVAENEGTNGACKVILTEEGTVIGAHALGNPASEIIAAAGMAIAREMSAEEWKRTVFPHPTVCEIFKELL